MVFAENYKNIVHMEKLPDGKIEGASAYHWKVTLDKAQLANAMKETLMLMQKDLSDKDEIKISDIETALKVIDIKPFDLFVKKGEYLPIQAKGSMDILDKTGKNIGTMDMSFIFSGSAPVEIKAPAESTDILYLLGPIVQSSLDTARQKGREAVIKANMSNLRVQAELFLDAHQNSYLGFCSSPELKGAEASIKNNYGGTEFLCKNTSKTYAISVKLPTAGYWCVDYTGVSKSFASPISGTACPIQ